jgi:predicted secreted protein
MDSLFSANAPGKPNVAGHNRNPFGMDCKEIDIAKQTDQIGFGRLLQRRNGRRLETQIGLVVSRDFSNQSLERQFADQEFRGLLVATNLPQRNLLERN